MPARPLEQLLHPDPQPGTGFFGRGWQTEFCPYDWTYVAGFPTFCVQLGIKNDKDGRTKLNSLSARATSIVPSNWTNFFVDPNVKIQGWSRYSSHQLRKAFRNEPMRLDKAALSVLLLHVAAQQQNNGLDAFSHLSLRPAIFWMPDYTREFYEKNVMEKLNDKEFRKEFLIKTSQISVAILGGMAEGKTVTYRTAELVRTFLREKFKIPQWPIVAILEKPDGVRKKTPCLEENVEHN